jgi:hypothetical protein
LVGRFSPLKDVIGQERHDDNKTHQLHHHRSRLTGFYREGAHAGNTRSVSSPASRRSPKGECERYEQRENEGGDDRIAKVVIGCCIGFAQVEHF